MNNIPKELLDKWQEDAEIRFASTQAKLGYIQGCKSTYLSMQAEIERIKGLISAAFDCCNFTKGSLKAEQWQKFKTEHNL